MSRQERDPRMGPPGETHEEWADRVIRNGPPPPKRVLEVVDRMRRNARQARRSA